MIGDHQGHLEVIHYSATAPGAAPGAAGVSTIFGDSLFVKNAAPKTRVFILGMHAFQQVQGYQQIIVNSGHDTTRNQRVIIEANEQTMRYPITGCWWEIFGQEQIMPTIVGSATSGDVEIGALTLWYEDLPGTRQRGITADQLVKRAVKPVTVECTLAGAAAGYGATELINAESDLLKANRDYAILGGMTDTPIASICIRGSDTGNVRVGIPGANTHSDMTNEFFVGLSRAYGLPCIPVINSGNRNSTELSVATNENSVTPRVSLQLMLLGE